MCPSVLPWKHKNLPHRLFQRWNFPFPQNFSGPRVVQLLVPMWEEWWGCASSGKRWGWCGKHHSDKNKAGRGVRSWPALRPWMKKAKSKAAEQPEPMASLWVPISSGDHTPKISKICISLSQGFTDLAQNMFVVKNTWMETLVAFSQFSPCSAALTPRL